MSDSLKIKQIIECCTGDQSMKFVNFFAFFSQIQCELTTEFAQTIYSNLGSENLLL